MLQMVAPSANASKPTIAYVKQGTEITLRLSKQITTERRALNVGDLFDLETAAPVMLGTLVVVPEGSKASGEVMYVDVVDSVRPLRFSVSAGSRRPFYPAVTGMAILAFLPEDEQARHIAEAGNKPFPSAMISKEDLPDILAQIRKRGIAYVRNGSFDGVSAVASPIFAAQGNVISSVAVVGPTDRINQHHERIEHLVFAAGERIARMLGFTADYPPEAG